ncbi:PH domain-containing protein [Lishizhenia tianjinensis]|uniref:PH domain-containing protein n=1 Tax=Lishizhenia tianjinensis TaxID=477690 RepID=A0A1I6Y5S5_9FLAO|nr:PH domain-containing protein [Lishizhenia tianjinensis]SFT45757.1 PH domain-containing protein [Lishizhenia tianjinensis]
MKILLFSQQIIETMVFKSRIDTFFAGLMFLLLALFVWVFYMEVIQPDSPESFVGSICLGITMLCILWFSLTCKYTLENNVLRYSWGPMKGSLLINTITHIERNTMLWSGIRPATARKGLVIKYEKYNEIYISPKNEDEFIQELLKRNAGIIVTQKQ